MSGISRLALGAWLVAGSALAQPPVPAAPAESPPAPAVEDLGGGRYRVGSIELDKAAGRFSVQGRVIRLDPPLEYVAVATGGVKNYESLLELDTDGIHFNLACILVGLDPERAGRAQFQADPAPLAGDRVALWLSWAAEGGTRRVSVGEALAGAADSDAKPSDQWVYIGSMFGGDGAYLAHTSGSLIGFIHDPVAVIEHRLGIGIGQYGSVSGRKDLPWEVGTPVTLTVERLAP
jgi:hypothetical protein